MEEKKVTLEEDNDNLSAAQQFAKEYFEGFYKSMHKSMEVFRKLYDEPPMGYYWLGDDELNEYFG